jgi:hypothetical protein
MVRNTEEKYYRNKMLSQVERKKGFSLLVGFNGSQKLANGKR